MRAAVVKVKTCVSDDPQCIVSVYELRVGLNDEYPLDPNFKDHVIGRHFANSRIRRMMEQDAARINKLRIPDAFAEQWFRILGAKPAKE